MLVSIITPTTGFPKLSRLLSSINKQTYTNIEHLIVVDGNNIHGSKVDKILEEVPVSNPIKRHIFRLPYSTGNTGYLGHKIYAAISQIINGDYVIFLDEDNFLDEDHVETYVNLVNKGGYDWLYCLRKIVDKEGNYICNDDCESLGHLSKVFYTDDNLIDTNCYFVKKSVVTNCSYIWNESAFNDFRNPDRKFAKHLMVNYPRFECTYKYSLNYMIDNRDTSVKSNLFISGNGLMTSYYGTLPWNRKKLFIIHFNPQQTSNIIKRIYEKEKPSIGHKQWMLNILDQMDDHMILNGYSPYIPSNSIILVHVCHIADLPAKLLERTDVIKIIYTIESPNVRHQLQWSTDFLYKHFNIIITYWSDLIKNRGVNMVNFPFIYKLDTDNKYDLELLETNRDTNRSTCIILQNRPFNQQYTINGITLNSQDYLREEYAKNIPNMYCYGDTWNKLSDNMTCVKTKDRFLDLERPIDFMRNHTFTLIIENCNADGYISEKIYDAFSVGSIPLYYGNTNSIVDIPKDMYIDLTTIPTSQINQYMDSLTDEDIEKYRKNIYDRRIEIFNKVSVRSYNNLLKSMINEINTQLKLD